MTAPWITYRPELKVLDCTIRDGGLCNDHLFEDDLVRQVYQTCVEAGIDYMELGYKGSKKLFTRGKFGDWKYCDEDDIRRVVGDNESSLKLAAVISPSRLPRARIVLSASRGSRAVNSDAARLAETGRSATRVSESSFSASFRNRRVRTVPCSRSARSPSSKPICSATLRANSLTTASARTPGARTAMETPTKMATATKLALGLMPDSSRFSPLNDGMVTRR